MADYSLSLTGAQVNERLNSLAVSSTTVTGNGITAYLYKYGRMVCVTITGQVSANIPAMGSGVVLTIPTGYRPIIEVYHNIGTNLFVIPASGGVFTTAGLSKNAWFQFSQCYICA